MFRISTLIALSLFTSISLAAECISKSGEIKIYLYQGTMGLSGVNIEVGDFKINTQDNNLGLASRWFDENILNASVFNDPKNGGSQILLLKTRSNLSTKFPSDDDIQYKGTIDIDLRDFGKNIFIKNHPINCIGNPFDV